MPFVGIVQLNGLSSLEQPGKYEQLEKLFSAIQGFLKKKNG